MVDFLKQQLVLLAFLIIYIVIRNFVMKKLGKTPLTKRTMIDLVFVGFVGINIVPVLSHIF